MAAIQEALDVVDGEFGRGRQRMDEGFFLEDVHERLQVRTNSDRECPFYGDPGTSELRLAVYLAPPPCWYMRSG